MNTKQQTPEPIGTVWCANALIQYIDETTFRWVTVGQCIDTPNAVATELAKCRKQHPGKCLWTRSDSYGRILPRE